jgi:hypothetical protein
MGSPFAAISMNKSLRKIRCIALRVAITGSCGAAYGAACGSMFGNKAAVGAIIGGAIYSTVALISRNAALYIIKAPLHVIGFCAAQVDIMLSEGLADKAKRPPAWSPLRETYDLKKRYPHIR